MENRKIIYRFNPYTFARISAMKSLLLKKEDYDRIMKMDPSEIIKFLQDGVYRDEINTLAIKFEGVKLVENALNKHLSKIFLKLKRISDPNLQYLMNQYLKRYDFWNLKTMLRAKQTGMREEELMELLLPVGTLNYESLKRLYSKQTIREIISECSLINTPQFSQALNNFETTSDLFELENMLDYHYYTDTVEFAEKIPSEGRLFREFFQYEFDVYNLNLILKKIFFKLDRNLVKKYLVPGSKELSRRMQLSLLEKDNINSFLRELSNTHYAALFRDFREGTTDPLLRAEILFDEFLLKKSILLFHQHPLTVDVVLGFMFAKEIEVRNLRTIIKSKKLEFTEDYVKKLIIV